MSQLRCQQHQAPAGWRCTACERALCPACAAMKALHPGEAPACTRCGSIADVLKRPRRETASLAERIPAAFLWPWRGGGLMTLAVVVVVWSLSGVFGARYWLGIPLIITVLFATVRATAQGEDEVEVAEFTGWGSLAATVLEFALVTAPSWLSLWLYLRWLAPGVAPNPAVLLFLLLLAVLWMPMAFIMAATKAPLLSLINPFTVYGTAFKAGSDFLLSLGVWVLALGLMGLAWGVGLLLDVHSIPILTALAKAALLLAPLLVGARVAGLLLYVSGDRLDYDLPERFLDPVLGSATPTGVLPDFVLLPSQREPRSYEPIELGAAEPVEPGAAAALGTAPAEPSSAGNASSRPYLTLDAAALPSLEVQRLGQLRAAMSTGDAAGAVEVWRGAALPGLRTEELWWVARAASAQGEDGPALAALEGAASVASEPEERARAFVVLGQFLDARLGRTAEAIGWMERVALESPGGAAARFASQWLSSRSPPAPG